MGKMNGARILGTRKSGRLLPSIENLAKRLCGETTCYLQNLSHKPFYTRAYTDLSPAAIENNNKNNNNNTNNNSN